MKPPKLRRTNPTKILAQLAESTAKELDDLIELATRLIEQETARSQPDPEHEALAGFLRKAARERRERHSAPTLPDEALGKALGSPAYLVPSYLEPLAELARKHPQNELETALRGERSHEEKDARAKADAWERKHTQAWGELLAKHQGDPEKAQADPTWGPTDQLAALTATTADLTEERWDDLRAEAREATRKCLEYLREDGQPLVPFSLKGVYARNALDKSTATEYNEDMSTEIFRFRLTIPENSLSGRIEKALEQATAEMNSHPLKVNGDTWSKNRTAQQKVRDELYTKCHQAAGKSFRPHSPRDCSKVLFEDQGLTPRRINKRTGEPSTDQETLEALQAAGSTLAGLIKDAREVQAKVSQLDTWEPYAKAGEVQTEWDSLGSPHARYTSSGPNLQSRIREIRETIEAPEAHHLQSFDLGQAEYVTWASLSGDQTLAKAFADGHDFHLTMFEELHKAAPDVDLHGTPPRQFGKTVNFALLYLQQPYVLAQKLGVTTQDADELMKAYAARAPDAIRYRDEFLAKFDRTGFSYTKFGRTREVGKPTRRDKHELEKTAWHMHVSGTAAEILKIKQAKAHHRLRKAGLEKEDVRLIIQMHDELIYQVKDEHREQAAEIILGVFHEEIPGFLPFKTDHRTGKTWLDVSK